MTSQEFAEAVAKRLNENFPSWAGEGATVEPGRDYHTVSFDRYVADGASTPKLERLVCRLVEEVGVDPSLVRFDSCNGHVLVQLRADGGGLSERSVWRRLHPAQS